MSDNQFFDALRVFDGSRPVSAAVIAAPRPAASSNDLCSTYATVRPVFEGVLPFLKAIPGIGPRIGTAIEALVAALDVVCPRSSGPTLNALTMTYGRSNDAFFDALRAFPAPTASAALTPAMAAITLPDVCALYKKVKPILDTVVPIIGLIPGFGTAAATAIRALMAILDSICPSGSDTP